tara:strand:- start:562 stop:1122 length:561 start_codon:yes stop_codon:yes gene_type:complete
MKKILSILILSLLFFSNVNAEERKNKLNNLFKQLKNSQGTKAIEIENKIWEIWSIHPSNDRRGFRLTELLDQGSLLIDRGELNRAYKIFTQIIVVDPNWPEAWNKRALVLYLMNQYQASLDDIKKTLIFEPRHFGALSGQALNYIKLKEYEKAIASYEAAQEFYPAIDDDKKMIPKLQNLINEQAI